MAIHSPHSFANETRLGVKLEDKEHMLKKLLNWIIGLLDHVF